MTTKKFFDCRRVESDTIEICRLTRSLPALMVSIRGAMGSKSAPALALPVSVHQTNVASRSELPFRRTRTNAVGALLGTSVISEANSMRDGELSAAIGGAIPAG